SSSWLATRSSSRRPASSTGYWRTTFHRRTPMAAGAWKTTRASWTSAARSACPPRPRRGPIPSPPRVLSPSPNPPIYNTDLVTFPSVHDVAGNPAVTLQYVANGRWKPGASGGFNAEEARRTAELVMAHFRHSPDLSLGVIAFSQRQQLRILDELERLRRANP